MLRVIEAPVLQHLLALLRDHTVPVHPIQLTYADYAIRNTAAPNVPLPKDPLRGFTFQRGKEEVPLAFVLKTWDTDEGRHIPSSVLVIDLPGLHNDVVGFVLHHLLQDDQYVHLGFRFGNGKGGKNRWFGLTKRDTRTQQDRANLEARIGEVLREYFPSDLKPHPRPGLGKWKILTRLPVAELAPTATLAQRTQAKTKLLEALAHTFLIAEKLRDESLAVRPKPVPAAVYPHPLNQILYGPPGTGKTYATTAWAVAILEGVSPQQLEAAYRTRPDELRQRYEQYRAAGRIQFATFHQAFSYEDFVEGIKPELSTAELRYQIEPGIFRRLAEEASTAWLQFSNPTDEPQLDFDTLYEEYLIHLKHRLQEAGGSLIIPTRENRDAEITGITPEGAISIRHGGAPTNYNVGRRWTHDVFVRYAHPDEIVPLNQRMRQIGGPNASLQWAIFRDLKAFEEHYLPTHLLDLSGPEVVDDEPLPEVANEAATLPPRYVLILDEINRGNVAGIFGELITLLEDDKRAGEAHALTLTLPYSKQPFTVPPNLYLLGTMNTADRSVEALDTALRRRFAFTEVAPRPALLSPAAMVARLWWKYQVVDWKDEPYRTAETQLYQMLGFPLQGKQAQEPLWKRIRAGEDPVQVFAGITVNGLNLELLLEAINLRLEFLLGRDYRLGHAWLMGAHSLDSLRTVFRNKIIPQLQEYFFGNWGRIGQVLGEAFVKVNPAISSPLLQFAEEPEPEGRPLYAIRDVDWTLEEFRRIYESVTA
ncbi:McrB family protein [Hymenobacter sp. B81]|uniref:McrB family protein n=1 Tax=Hymenobacter sp. B81 TaxID=3344878 RepID=UPI0037DD605E